METINEALKTLENARFPTAVRSMCVLFCTWVDFNKKYFPADSAPTTQEAINKTARLLRDMAHQSDVSLACDVLTNSAFRNLHPPTVPTVSGVPAYSPNLSNQKPPITAKPPPSATQEFETALLARKTKNDLNAIATKCLNNEALMAHKTVFRDSVVAGLADPVYRLAENLFSKAVALEEEELLLTLANSFLANFITSSENLQIIQGITSKEGKSSR